MVGVVGHESEVERRGWGRTQAQTRSFIASPSCVCNNQNIGGMGWVGLGRDGLDWVGMGWVGSSVPTRPIRVMNDCDGIIQWGTGLLDSQ